MIQRAFLIDVSAIFFRYFYALPVNWFSADGQATHCVYGFTRWLQKFLSDQDPKYVAACFDESLGSGFRHRLYPAYKCRRPLPDENIVFQFSGCKEICRLLGVRVFASEEYEADDLIATLAIEHRQKGGKCTVISRDKDLGQILSDGDVLWDYPDGAALDRIAIREKFGVAPEAIADLFALAGDAIDDIPGVPGIGLKTAKTLIEHFGNIENLIERASELPQLSMRGASGLHKKIVDFEQEIRLYKSITQLEYAADLGDLRSIQKLAEDYVGLRRLSDHLGLGINW